MYKVALYLLLPLMWVNLTTGGNEWALLGIGIGQIVYWVMIVLAWYVTARSPYQLFATVTLLLAMTLRMMEALTDSEALYALRVAALAVIFVIVGARLYGANPFLLRKQLVVFLALCVPVMFLQILGVSSFLMGWNTGYAHDPSILALEEIGTFKEIPLYPTLFVGIDELHYSIGQGRPVGLLHSSNVLSIFVVFAVALNLVVPRTPRLTISDLVITSAVVLTMSKMVFAVTLLLYLGLLLSGRSDKRSLAAKLTMALGIGLLAYFLLFPGLFAANFSREMIWTSILLRLLGLLHAVGIEDLVNLFRDQLSLIGFAYSEDESYSGVAALLSSDMAIPALILAFAAAVLYGYRVWQMKGWPVSVYVIPLLVCVLTQFAVPFVAAPSFQLIAGFALFPLFTKLRRIPRVRAVKHVPAGTWSRPDGSPVAS